MDQTNLQRQRGQELSNGQREKWVCWYQMKKWMHQKSGEGCLHQSLGKRSYKEVQIWDTWCNFMGCKQQRVEILRQKEEEDQYLLWLRKSTDRNMAEDEGDMQQLRGEDTNEIQMLESKMKKMWLQWKGNSITSLSLIITYSLATNYVRDPLFIYYEMKWFTVTVQSTQPLRSPYPGTARGLPKPSQLRLFATWSNGNIRI